MNRKLLIVMLSCTLIASSLLTGCAKGRNGSTKEEKETKLVSSDEDLAELTTLEPEPTEEPTPEPTNTPEPVNDAAYYLKNSGNLKFPTRNYSVEAVMENGMMMYAEVIDNDNAYLLMEFAPEFVGYIKDSETIHNVFDVDGDSDEVYIDMLTENGEMYTDINVLGDRTIGHIESGNTGRITVGDSLPDFTIMDISAVENSSASDKIEGKFSIDNETVSGSLWVNPETYEIQEFLYDDGEVHISYKFDTLFELSLSSEDYGDYEISSEEFGEKYMAFYASLMEIPADEDNESIDIYIE